MKDYLFRGSLADIDPDVAHLVDIEAERQIRKLILIPSESQAPGAIREALGSVFQNLYAEGYPDEETRTMNEAEILDYTKFLSHFRRYADPRYYKGVEYCDVIESLARRRCAEAFATPSVSADQLYVNVQALSGAPANNAVFGALLNPGDTILGMNLLHGGHLTHGSSVNRSGKLYHAAHYNVDPVTEKINYDAVAEIAKASMPKIIIAGYSSYPWIPDWKRFREIADSVGALLLADVSHIAGLIAGKAVPSPIGYAHVITFTTHKTLCGPRGACIITQDAAMARKIDRSVFPGEQGGPHVHAFAAYAVTFKLAQTPEFRELQSQIIKNNQALTNRMQERGLRISFGGTDSHLGNVDCKTIVGSDGTTLSGDMCARILDVAGIVLNRNTIPGDKTAQFSTGIRYGTPWMTQRGLKEPEMVKVADAIADIMFATKPYSIETRQGPAARAKVDFGVLEDVKIRIRTLAEKAGADVRYEKHGYPHFFYIDDKPAETKDWVAFDLKGDHVLELVNYIFTSDAEALKAGESQNTRLLTPKGAVDGVLSRINENDYRFNLPAEHAGLAGTWLRDLSDGYVAFDEDVTRRLTGTLHVIESKQPITKASGDPVSIEKPFHIGMEKGKGEAKPVFTWEEKEVPLRRTQLYDCHKQLGAKLIPFAGWEMPVWYTSVTEEHLATRQAAGLFDVAHMGVYQVEGPYAAVFLDSVCSNDVSSLDVGESLYTHFLDLEANVIDDTLIYRRRADAYLVVVNASNDDKDWAWLNAIREGKVRVDNDRPWVHAFGRNVIMRDLRNPKEGADMLVDIAIQGPKSREILLSLGVDGPNRRRIMRLKRTELCEAVVGGFELVVSRTGYTGERMAFELFVHPDKAADLWNALMKAGEPVGLKPCGLGARDSLRTEAGLPLYGHEMGGELNLGVAEAGFGTYVKTYKPWFIGRTAFLAKEAKRQGVVIRFRFTEKGVRMAHLHDPVLDRKGRVIGMVTSCAIDSEGFLTGQAYLDLKSIEEGTPIFIFQGAPKSTGKPPVELATGDRVTLPTPAVVISRFPK